MKPTLVKECGVTFIFRQRLSPSLSRDEDVASTLNNFLH
jgi:hypothetical protein